MTQTTILSAMGFGERAGYSGMMLLIGMGSVFAVLAILWGVLEIFHRIVEAKSKAAAAATTATPATAPAKVQQIATPVQDDGALIAVITAAVAATMAQENGGEAPAFRVVSFRRL